MWYPDKAAFRAGRVSSNLWDKDSIGGYSVAMGNNTQAKGFSSTAFGELSKAFGNNSFAAGFANESYGQGAVAMGEQNSAAGSRSVAAGLGNSAMGGTSVALGNGNVVKGIDAMVIGFKNVNNSLASFVAGQYNDSISTSNPTAWVPTDPLFVIGNGSSATARSNAITVLKNSYTGINTAAPAYGLHVVNNNTNDGGHIDGIMVENTAPAASAGEAAISFKNQLFQNQNTKWMVGLNQNPNLTFDYGSSFAGGAPMILDTLGNIVITGGYKGNFLDISDSNIVFHSPATLAPYATTTTNFGNGNRFFWRADRAALRIGGTNSSATASDRYLGAYSLSAGLNSFAGGDFSVAFGNNCKTGSTSAGSFAYGNNCQALGLYGIAGGYDCISWGTAAVALGEGNTSVDGSGVAIGLNNEITGTASVGLGRENEVNNGYAFGFSNTVSASGTAVGFGLISKSYGTTVAGRYNTDYVVPVNDGAKPVFIVGGGTATNARSNAMVVTGAGRVQMTTLEVQDDVGSNLIPSQDDFYKLGQSGKRWKEVWSANPFLQTSDVRFKKNIRPMNYGLQTVLKMQPVSYNLINQQHEMPDLGFLAQDMEKLVPESVISPEGGGMKAMKYSNLIPVLVNAIKEQQVQIETLRKKIELLEKISD
jgi:hypothetical protein